MREKFEKFWEVFGCFRLVLKRRNLSCWPAKWVQNNKVLFFSRDSLRVCDLFGFLAKTVAVFARCLCRCNANSMASFPFARTDQESYWRFFCWPYRRWQSVQMGINGGRTPGHLLVSFSQKHFCSRGIQGACSAVSCTCCTSLIFV